ncbi:MAG: zinc ABC transporter substrate-binding protein [Synergistaceae bacterium]|nr:zinc ABC transporter substrate-binding protein [Synergistaceae bacterium]
MKLKTTFFLVIFLLTASFSASADDNEANAENFPHITAFRGHDETNIHTFSQDIHSVKVLSITCSLFPVYDFTRAITGNLADVRLLLKPGVEPHEFEPSALDVKALNDSDVFVFTSNFMEGWAEKVSRSLTHVAIIDASENITLMDNDPHIWLDLGHAQKMLMNISDKLCEISPENAETFTDNAKFYCSKLAELDEKLFALTLSEEYSHDENFSQDIKSDDKNFSTENASSHNPQHKTLIFAGEFSAQYFLRRYGFDYLSAYEGENEPSIRKLAEVMKFIRENRTRYIFSEPLNISQVTRSISEETGAEILTFDTAHNVKDENITFFEIMNNNYRNIMKALND